MINFFRRLSGAYVGGMGPSKLFSSEQFLFLARLYFYLFWGVGELKSHLATRSTPPTAPLFDLRYISLLHKESAEQISKGAMSANGMFSPTKDKSSPVSSSENTTLSYKSQLCPSVWGSMLVFIQNKIFRSLLQKVIFMWWAIVAEKWPISACTVSKYKYWNLHKK